jgi:hypothetical protein
MIGHRLRRSCYHELAALIAAFVSQVDHQDAVVDNIEVVLDEIEGFSGSPRQSMAGKPKNYLPIGGSSSGALVCR